MTSGEPLLLLYEQWSLLSEREGEAIRGGEWDKVAEAQREKEHLQRRIMAETGVLSRNGGGFAAQEMQERIRGVLNELIQKEKSNQSALTEQRRLADAAVIDCRTAGKNLRQLQRAYTLGRSASWQSYS